MFNFFIKKHYARLGKKKMVCFSVGKFFFFFALLATQSLCSGDGMHWHQFVLSLYFVYAVHDADGQRWFYTAMFILIFSKLFIFLSKPFIVLFECAEKIEINDSAQKMLYGLVVREIGYACSV